MKVIVDLCIVPIGVGVSLSSYIAACQVILQSTDVRVQMHAYGTNIEGEWDTVLGAVKACHEKIHEMGAPRVSTTLKLGTRTDRDQSMDDRINSVKEK
jgi:uncharacterized protein (TIGR00106 family)